MKIKLPSKINRRLENMNENLENIMNGSRKIDTNLQKKTTKALFCGKVKNYTCWDDVCCFVELEKFPTVQKFHPLHGY